MFLSNTEEMNIIIGPPARGDKFYNREKITKRLWRAIDSGTNIQMSAPRRIGKTSLMFHCLDNPKENYEVVYLITESINNKNDFFKRLVNETCKKLSNAKKTLNYLSQAVKSTKVKSIGLEGVTIESASPLDYHDEFITVIEHLDLQGHKLVLMIDEFAQTVVNIKNNEGELSAVNFLESVREIRINPSISEKVQFIFAGSIGIENVVSQLNAVYAINDLQSFTVPPFTKIEATKYIQNLANQDQAYNFSNDEINYFLEKLEWLSPYYVNVILNKIIDTCEDEEVITVTTVIIDDAFILALNERSYFKHWEKRLTSAFKGGEYKLARKVLDFIATNSIIGSPEITNIAVEYNLLDSYSEIINILKTDGYINNVNDSTEYTFNSPLIKQWWLNNVTN